MKSKAYIWIFFVLFSCVNMNATQGQSLTQSTIQSTDISCIETANMTTIRYLKQFYDSIDPSIQETYIVSTDDLFGVVDKDGHILIPCEYDSIEAADDYFILNCNELLGLADIEGCILIFPQYNELYCENDSVAVSIYGPEGGSGVIDKNNNILVPIVFEDAYPFVGEWALIIKKDTKKANFINKEGRYLLNEDADQCEGFFGEYAYIKYNTDYYIIDQKNTVFRKLNGTPIAYLNTNNLFLLDSNNTQYIYNADKDECIEINGEILDERGFQEGLIAIKRNDGKWGFSDSELNIVIPFMYDSVQRFNEGRSWVKQDGIYKLIDKTNTCYYTGNLLSASPFSEGLSAIKSDTGWGFIDRFGEIRLSPSIESNEDSLYFIDGYCDLLWSDPFAAIYIDHSFHKVIEYDNW